MKKSWYRRMLFSYFPIFLLTVTILVFISFLMLNEISHKEAVKADRLTTDYMVDRLTRSLKDIEMGVLEEIQKNDSYRSFLDVRQTEEDRQIIFDVAASLRGLVAGNSLIDSMYVYRIEDRQVLTRSGLVSWNAFADKMFIEQALARPEYDGWSDIRTYSEFSLDRPQRIISMYKREPLPFGTEGFVVINVNMYAVERMLREANNEELSFLNVRDRSGELLFSTQGSDAADEGKSSQVLNRVEMEGLGWTFESGMAAEQLFMWVSVVSYVWIVIGLLTVVLATCYILYITRKNYKPIRLMMNRVESITLRIEDFGKKMDELSLIDRTLDKLIQKTADYDKQRHENLLVNRRQLFHDILLGGRLDKVQGDLWKLGLVPEGAVLVRMAVIVAEISRYGDFSVAFSERDRQALKFALKNVMQELAQSDGMYGLCEWVSEDRMGIIVGFSGEDAPARERIRQFVRKGGEWVEEHLRMPLLFGVGQIEQSWNGIGHSYASALEALEHKMSLGGQSVIMSEEMPEHAGGNWFEYVQAGAELVREFRLVSGQWRDCADRLFERMHEDCLRDAEIRMLLQTTMDMLAKEVGGMSGELAAHFEDGEAQRWQTAEAEAASLQELKTVYLDRLTDIYRTYVSYSESKNHRAMINEMRSYIEENFDNPDLSLKHLSDRFNVTGKYASYLFKEEFNMKFVDFIVQLRMLRAEQLLAETAETVQQIALKVGYANSITFGRVFKRIVGVTPGDYRKLRMKPDKTRYNAE